MPKSLTKLVNTNFKAVRNDPALQNFLARVLAQDLKLEHRLGLILVQQLESHLRLVDLVLSDLYLFNLMEIITFEFHLEFRFSNTRYVW